MAAGLIPARLSSTRLARKALALVGGLPLIHHVVVNAKRARRLSRIVVATDDGEIARAAEAAGAEAVLTAPDHPSGTDRVAAAVAALGLADEILVNIQGDEPEIAPSTIDAVAALLENDATLDMSTAAAPLATSEDWKSPHRVKVVCDDFGRALYFSRSPIPYRRAGAGECSDEEWLARGTVLGHIGIYGYRRSSLTALVGFPPAALETIEKLEQLRALAAGMRIGVARVASSPAGIDTADDLEAFRRRYESRSQSR